MVGSLVFLPVDVRCTYWGVGRDGASTTMTLGQTIEAGSDIGEGGYLEEQDQGTPEPACHLKQIF